MKSPLLHGFASGIFAGICCFVYAQVYKFALGADFSNVVPIGVTFSACIAAGLLAGAIYGLFIKWFSQKADVIFHLLFTTITLLTLVAPFAFQLPLDVEMPELFPGYAVPFHFFPALAWFTLKPMFVRK